MKGTWWPNETQTVLIIGMGVPTLFVNWLAGLATLTFWTALACTANRFPKYF